MSTESKPAVMETKKVGPANAGRKPRQRTQRPGAKREKLVCRYCGSDDLAPSFIKRRDARCRACFKKRYGSAARQENSALSRKKAAK